MIGFWVVLVCFVVQAVNVSGLVLGAWSGHLGLAVLMLGVIAVSLIVTTITSMAER
jgi:hypothetical protein